MHELYCVNMSVHNSECREEQHVGTWITDPHLNCHHHFTFGSKSFW